MLFIYIQEDFDYHKRNIWTHEEKFSHERIFNRQNMHFLLPVYTHFMMDKKILVHELNLPTQEYKRILRAAIQIFGPIFLFTFSKLLV